jgi:hypothetical protein
MKFFKLTIWATCLINILFLLLVFSLSTSLIHAQEDSLDSEDFYQDYIEEPVFEPPLPETEDPILPWFNQPTDETPAGEGEYTEFNYCNDYPLECANQGNQNFTFDNNTTNNPYLGDPDCIYGDPITCEGSPFFGNQFTPVDPDTAEATGYIDLSYFNFGGLTPLPANLGFNPDDSDMEAKSEEAVAAGFAPVLTVTPSGGKPGLAQPSQDQAEANRALLDIQRIAANSPNSSFVPVYYNGELALQPKEQFCQQNPDLCNGQTGSLLDLSNRTRQLIDSINDKLNTAGYNGPAVLCQQLGGPFCEDREGYQIDPICRGTPPANHPNLQDIQARCKTDISSGDFTNILSSSYRDRLQATPECRENHGLTYCAILAASLAQGEAGILANAALSLANLSGLGEAASALDIINLALATRGLQRIPATAEAATSAALNNSRGQVLPISTVREIATGTVAREVETLRPPHVEQPPVIINNSTNLEARFGQQIGEGANGFVYGDGTIATKIIKSVEEEFDPIREIRALRDANGAGGLPQLEGVVYDDIGQIRGLRMEQINGPTLTRAGTDIPLNVRYNFVDDVSHAHQATGTTNGDIATRVDILNGTSEQRILFNGDNAILQPSGNGHTSPRIRPIDWGESGGTTVNDFHSEIQGVIDVFLLGKPGEFSASSGRTTITYPATEQSRQIGEYLTGKLEEQGRAGTIGPNTLRQILDTLPPEMRAFLH